MSYRYDNLVEKVVNSNIEKVDYEGTYVDKYEMMDDIKTLIKDISIGFIRWFVTNVEKTSVGYSYKGVNMSREELFNEFIKTV